jgi:hypothetical protein
MIVIFFFEEATTTVSPKGLASFIAPADHVPVSR